MIFLTPWFWSFFLIFSVVYWSIKSHTRAQCFWILAASLFFQFHFARWHGMLPIIALVLLTYAAGRWYHNKPDRRILTGAITLNVLALIYYKYANFLGFSFIRGWSAIHVVAPIGISFFVFEFIHYLVEIGHGMAPAENLTHFWVFASFFPSMVAGPIKRFPDFDSQLNKPTSFSMEAIVIGLSRILLGCFKKVVLAEPCHAYAVHFESNPGHHPLILLLLALSLQIYFDFAGYSDMAIGIGHCLGFRLPENFQNPYFAISMNDFWRRWHMSLSTWIRDYIYIPLGGSRVSRTRKIINGATAMFLCGLWHGPALHFGLWGLWHGLWLGLLPSSSVVKDSEMSAHGPWSRLFYWQDWLSRLTTLGVVAVGWLIFFYDIPTLIKLCHASRSIF
jgi:alginate O-acetyltransferase complex protein AlgI